MPIEPHWEFKVVYGMETFYAHDKEHAWEIIGARPFGQPYQVYPLTESAKAEAYEFVPF